MAAALPRSRITNGVGEEPLWCDFLFFAPLAATEGFCDLARGKLSNRWHILWILPVGALVHGTAAAWMMVAASVALLAAAIAVGPSRPTGAHLALDSWRLLQCSGFSFARIFWPIL